MRLIRLAAPPKQPSSILIEAMLGPLLRGDKNAVSSLTAPWNRNKRLS